MIFLYFEFWNCWYFHAHITKRGHEVLPMCISFFFVPELCPWFLFMPPRWRVGGGGHINLPLSVLSSVRI
jgi:hypothetical protein